MNGDNIRDVFEGHCHHGSINIDMPNEDSFIKISDMHSGKYCPVYTRQDIIDGKDKHNDEIKEIKTL